MSVRPLHGKTWILTRCGYVRAFNRIECHRFFLILWLTITISPLKCFNMCIKSFSPALHNKSTRVRVQAWPAVKKYRKPTPGCRKSGLSCFKCFKHAAQGFVRRLDLDDFDRKPSRNAVSGRMSMFSLSLALPEMVYVCCMRRAMFLLDSWHPLQDPGGRGISVNDECFACKNHCSC